VSFVRLCLNDRYVIIPFFLSSLAVFARSVNSMHMWETVNAHDNT